MQGLGILGGGTSRRLRRLVPRALGGPLHAPSQFPSHSLPFTAVHGRPRAARLRWSGTLADGGERRCTVLESVRGGPPTCQHAESVPVTSADWRRSRMPQQTRGRSQDSTGRDVAHTVTHGSWVNIEARLVRRTGCLASRAGSPGANCAGAVV